MTRNDTPPTSDASQAQAHLDEICARPDDDAPRLAYAGWLEGHGTATAPSSSSCSAFSPGWSLARNARARSPPWEEALPVRAAVTGERRSPALRGSSNSTIGPGLDRQLTRSPDPLPRKPAALHMTTHESKLMNRKYARLIRAFRLARRRPPADLATALNDLPEVGRLPSPWVTWTLLGLVRHRSRLLRMGHVVRTQNLRPDRPGEVGLAVPPEGVVPGLLEWEYRRHGIRFCVRHRVTGADRARAGRGLPARPAPERGDCRLRLRGAGEGGPARRPRALSAAGRGGPGVGARLGHALLLPQWGEAGPRRCLWLAALIGDWPAAEEAARALGDEALVALTQERAVQVQARERPQRGGAALLALADLGDPEAMMNVVVRRSGGDRWCPNALGLLRRTDPDAWTDPDRPTLAG